MKRTTKKAVSILAASALLALTLAGCGNDTTTDTASDTTEDTSASTLSGSVATNGSTSMEEVMGVLTEQFKNDNPDVTVTYDPTGSGTGIEAAANGTADIGLSSRALTDEEIASGLVGMILLVPGIQRAFDLSSGACLLAAILVLAIMILPSIISVSETSLRAVPEEYEQASLALGATHLETVFRVSIPAARSGVATAIVLGVGRAIGEAMAIIMVAGNVANMPGLFTSVRFLTTAIASEMSYASVGSLHRNALFSIGLVLFLFIMLINVFLNVFIKRKKEG